MTQPRSNLIDPSTTPYYHCVSRCVRRAFLCGRDERTGQCFEHRRQWIEDRLLELSGIFALDVCSYAVMSNHYHVVLFVNQQQADGWDLLEIVSRWHQLCKGSALSQRFYRGELLDSAELTRLSEVAKIWKARLTDISWFMRYLNEFIARESNREDQCSGRFWEGRFKSQALLDEKALAACMAYVDLNPIRAKMAETPETSDHTSIKQRILSAKQAQQPTTLLPFVGNPKEPMPTGLPFRLEDYIELVDWSGRCLREDKRGAINEKLPPILDRLQIDPKQWTYLNKNFESRFKSLVGSGHTVRATCEQLGKRWVHGIRECERLLSPPPVIP
ncbi:transposase [Microbulbifer aggregans]|uniref:transposase n=1 Tax=Microbulbifer aggregans TaxID=1769779 RepID=UPI001CFC819C|nr:transposase [Microbulbifer aggregans]